jgi:hygromycin-B 4-O-kinase
MSTHKTTANKETILAFLKEDFSPDISNFETITGGEGSQAYSFRSNDREYIIRINKHYTLGFRKDEYAFKNYDSLQIPIPEIYKIGKIDNELRFCISQKVEGKILTSFSSEENIAFLPSFFEVLDSIHNTDISNYKGFGKWDSEGQGGKESWKEHVLGVDKYSKGSDDTPSLFETTFLEKDFWDTTYAQLTKLISYCPEEPYLVHGDYGFNNVLSDGIKITGVIDWENSMYGDFLFDVAWLSFWSKKIDYEKLYLEHSVQKGMEIENYHERILCYKVSIGLGSMSFFAYSDQKEKYDGAKKAIMDLLENA